MANNLYTTHADEFSKTRTAPWDGWLALFNNPDFIIKDQIRVLDLGCGNGRFLKFVQEHREVETYLGVDNSEALIQEAKNIGGEYKNLDIDNTKWDLEDKEFDLIVAFGLQHHLTSFENREYLLKKISSLLTPTGAAVVTYWQFLDYERYKNKVKKLPGENNYSMSFGQAQDARFCHYTDLSEIEKLEAHSGLKLVANYRADGRDNTENIYRIYQKA